MARKNKTELLEQYKTLVTEHSKVMLKIIKYELSLGKDKTNDQLTDEIKELRSMLKYVKSYLAGESQ